PFFILLCFLAASVTPAAASPAPPTATVKRQAGAQFQRAEQLRATLNLKPLAKRTLGDYRQVVSSYRRVYLITPRANEVPEALIAIAQLYTEMGERFGRNYYQNAADSYRFLLREYPTSRHAPDAMLVCAKLQRDQLADYAGATQTYKDFLKHFPRSPRKREAQEGVAELALLENNSKPAPDKDKDKTTPDASIAEAVLPKDESSDATPSSTAPRSVGIPRLRRIRSAVTEDATRVTIDLEDVVHYNSGRLEKPDRIFFDLREARLTSEVAREVARENANVDGDVLTAIRAAQNHTGVVRIVLNVNRVKEYVASISPNPPQLLIDLYRKQPPPAILKIARASHNSSNIHETTDPHGPEAGNIELDGDGKSDTLVRTSQPAALKVSRTTSKSDLDQPAIAPQPTHDGQSTLTRALGLKIGRIVIDAGHGGHDTGTIGPTGLMEKDLCLDVALRLGKIIKQRLPGAEVVFTRSDDSFIPLEERTAIANESHADLFISIHANSSQDHGARGIETYYLNLKGSPEAMEVAARENAVANVGIHDLEDLVKKIARNEKIDESREFAEDIQASLSQRVQKANKTVKNRGVRKAPFVVLIGGDMPSILTEISFLSNPADEQLLKQPENRQRVAEGLYQGVASYLQSLNSVTFNGRSKPTTPRSTSAKLEHSPNAQ
ncbi:MAG TPA: N-acetylmuramoyl-L-alanine amidase, partial [Candidatus Eremiobacteraceae bacterium]|nr:N-acetylmuramoyl-L-alanine amidase [Candidatus Eremiobacteraceae bacterium]